MDRTIHTERRKRFLEALPKDAVALFRAAPMAIRSHDVEFPYRADNDLLYLTGFPEPETVAILDPASETPFTLFVRPRDPERETWTGRRFGPEGAQEKFGADAAFTHDKLDEQVMKALEPKRALYASLGRDEAWTLKLLSFLRRSQATRPRTGAPALALIPPDDILHEMRLFKKAEEIALMRRAAEISTVAHREAFAAARPGVSEHEIAAILDFAFRRLGGSGPAYPSIVASGVNATILHYVENTRTMEPGDLLLIDAAAEYESYCADVTRTAPVGGRFTAEQRSVYDLVLEAQLAATLRVRPGNTFDQVHDAAVDVLVDGLRSLGVLTESREEILEKHLYRAFYMHRTSHWLGMDVHDVGAYRAAGASRMLEPGMVLTVEPGLYFSNGKAERFRDIGVRIEDDVLVTPAGHEILTAAIPKAVADIER